MNVNITSEYIHGLIKHIAEQTAHLQKVVAVEYTRDFSVKEITEMRGCTSQAVYWALKMGYLNRASCDGCVRVLNDEKFREWASGETKRRNMLAGARRQSETKQLKRLRRQPIMISDGLAEIAA